MRAIMEGIGFQMGAIFEPYNANMRHQLRSFAELPETLRLGLATGLGWGARQRYRSPPAAVPEGLCIRTLLEDSDRESFDRAFCGVDLPRESKRDR